MNLIKKLNLIAILSIALFLSACNEIVDNKKLLKQAYDFSDVNTAIIAAQSIYLEDTVNNAFMLDTLLSLYANTNNLISINKLSELYPNQFKEYNQLNVIAQSRKNLRLYDESIAVYEKMLTDFPDKGIDINYQLGELGFLKGDAAYCDKHLNAVIKNEKSKEDKLVINSGDGLQEVSYYHAALNILGFLSMQMENYEQARQIYTAVLTENPEFQLAKNNYQLLQQLIENPPTE